MRNHWNILVAVAAATLATACASSNDLDGVTEVLGCTECHGDAARAPAGFQLTDVAPPTDVLGRTASAQVGVHASHLSPDPVIGVSAGVACTACHVVPTDRSHVDGVAVVTPRDPAGAPSGTFTAGAGGAAGTCASTYCHGNFAGGATGNAPSWAGAGTQTCASCHGAAPDTGKHPGSSNAADHDGIGCQHCHLDVAATSGGVHAITAGGRALHVNGAKDVKLSRDGTTESGTWNGSSCATACHIGGQSHSW